LRVLGKLIVISRKFCQAPQFGNFRLRVLPSARVSLWTMWQRGLCGCLPPTKVSPFWVAEVETVGPVWTAALPEGTNARTPTLRTDSRTVTHANRWTRLRQGCLFNISIMTLVVRQKSQWRLRDSQCPYTCARSCSFRQAE
jgi:hypothetical protein